MNPLHQNSIERGLGPLQQIVGVWKLLFRPFTSKITHLHKHPDLLWFISSLSFLDLWATDVAQTTSLGQNTVTHKETVTKSSFFGLVLTCRIGGNLNSSFWLKLDIVKDRREKIPAVFCSFYLRPYLHIVPRDQVLTTVSGTYHIVTAHLVLSVDTVLLAPSPPLPLPYWHS